MGSLLGTEKFVRSVTWQLREGRREAEMGWKRTSSNALSNDTLAVKACHSFNVRHKTYLVSAYDLNPYSNSCGSKVPIHPLRLLYPLLDTVFHVTNKGCSSPDSRLRLAKENNEFREFELIELAGVAVPETLLPLLDEDLPEFVDGRLLLDDAADWSVFLFRRRDIAAGRAGSSEVSASIISASSSSDRSSASLSRGLLLLA